MKQELIQVRKLTLMPMTTAYQERQSQKWDKIISNPEAFAPREVGKVDIKKILVENRKFGKSVVRDLNKKIFKKSTPEDIDRRLAGRKKIVCIGYGQGYDSDVIRLGTFAGYEIWYIDISYEACLKADTKIFAIWGDIKAKTAKPPLELPYVHQAEISSVLIDPDSIGLDLSTVEGWYMCRTLFALSKRRAKFVLQKIAESLSIQRDPEKHNWIHITNPLAEDNPHRLICTSIILNRKQIVSNLRRGAGRPIRIDEANHNCFKRKYTSMLIKAE